VLVNKFDYVIKHMVSQVQRTAFSPIVRDSADLAAALQGPPSTKFQMGIPATHQGRCAMCESC
jgi:hypothetical protein